MARPPHRGRRRPGRGPAERVRTHPVQRYVRRATEEQQCWRLHPRVGAASPPGRYGATYAARRSFGTTRCAGSDATVSGQPARWRRPRHTTMWACPAAASALCDEINAEPGAGFLLDIIGPGGCGKTPLIEAAALYYTKAGMPVIRDLQANGDLTGASVLIDDAHLLDDASLGRLWQLAQLTRPATACRAPSMAGEPRADGARRGPYRASTPDRARSLGQIGHGRPGLRTDGHTVPATAGSATARTDRRSAGAA